MAITRKPPSSGNAEETGNTSLPYPVTPISPQNGLGNFRNNDDLTGDDSKAPHSLNPGPSHSQTSIPTISDLSEGWVDGDPHAQDDYGYSKVSLLSVDEQRKNALPDPLRVGSSSNTPRGSIESQRQAANTSSSNKHEIPPALRVQAPQEIQSTNPFHRTNSYDAPSTATEEKDQLQNSSDIWAEFAAAPAPPSEAPPPPPVTSTSDDISNGDGTKKFGNLSINDTADSTTSYGRPGLNVQGPVMAGARSNDSYIDPAQTPLADSSNNPFADSYRNEVQSSPWATEQSQQQPDHDPFSGLHELDAQSSRISEQNTQHERVDTSTEPAVENLSAQRGPQDALQQPSHAIKEQQNLEEHEPPLRVDVPSTTLPSHAEPETPNTRTQRQRSETYQVKHIRWLDSTSTGIRTTPIMIQNANGPCPLLALVNALTLSTPPHLNTPLVETLRVREQVSLGLLLDAVFDELMSGRRGGAAQGLPDVGELYTFLINLHTGLNVNPRFTPLSSQSPTLIDSGAPDSSLAQETRKVGGFEETKEMKLYATFSIPLIHGWLPPRTHPAYDALQRSANTYEDAQNLLFREDELEDKLQTQGLSPEEQQTLEDIASTKYFLSSSATQLTGYGLDTITDTLFPGSIAILFRNDHFSTLYKQPRSGQILTLVTDAGYAGHQEVVWESLVDVSGEGSEFYSGDFRPVSNNGTGSTAYTQDNSGWTTVSRSGRARSNEGDPPAQPPRPDHSTTIPEEYNLPSSNNTEQEDADLALALQLQEEEEENNRRSAQSRRREEEQASQAYLSSQAAAPRLSSRPQAQRNSAAGAASPNADRRGRFSDRNNSNAANHIVGDNDSSRPLPLPPRRNRDPEAGEDAPPPSYEQASQSEPYHPPANQSAYTNPGAARPAAPLASNHSAYGGSVSSIGSRPNRRTSGGYGGPDDGRLGGNARRRSHGQQGLPVGHGGRDSRDKDCIIM